MRTIDIWWHINAPGLVAFNADKRYLAELQAPTVPTVFVEPAAALPSLDGEVVVKPNILRRRARHRTLWAVNAR